MMQSGILENAFFAVSFGVAAEVHLETLSAAASTASKVHLERLSAAASTAAEVPEVPAASPVPDTNSNARENAFCRSGNDLPFWKRTAFTELLLDSGQREFD